jgi:GNAT superfamily N-acetyltransferase
MCAYDGDVLAGVFVGGLSEFYFGNDVLAYDLLWYVGKEYRGSRTGLRLLKMFESWATDLGADRIQVGISSGLSMDRTGALLERMGFSQIGGLYRTGK